MCNIGTGEGFFDVVSWSLEDFVVLVDPIIEGLLVKSAGVGSLGVDVEEETDDEDDDEGVGFIVVISIPWDGEEVELDKEDGDNEGMELNPSGYSVSLGTCVWVAVILSTCIEVGAWVKLESNEDGE